MFTPPVRLPPRPLTTRYAVTDGSESARGERKKRPSSAFMRGSVRRRKCVSISRYSAGGVQEKNFVCYANERNHLQPLQHSTCFNYTLISSINTPIQAGWRGAASALIITSHCYRVLIMRRLHSASHRGERLKNATALTVAATLTGAPLPSPLRDNKALQPW